MSGMQMMLSSMIGMKPDELEKAVTETMGAIKRGVELMEQINNRCIALQDQNDQIIALLERHDDGSRDTASRDKSNGNSVQL